MDVLDDHGHLIKVSLVEVVGAVGIDALYLLLFLLFIGHCRQDQLETVEDESVFVVGWLAVLMDDCVSDPDLGAETDEVDQDLSGRVDQLSFFKLLGSLLITCLLQLLGY